MTVLNGLKASVNLFRDDLGIAHIKADNSADAFFAQGYIHAQDRLWQMDQDRIKAQGRLAEYVGQTGVAQDQLMRRFRLYETAKLDYERVQPNTRAMLDAYAAGVNAFIELGTDLGAEFDLLNIKPEPWKPWDGLAVYKIRHVMMGVWEGKAWRAKLINQVGPERLLKLYPGPRQGDLLMIPPGTLFTGQVQSMLDELTAAMSEVDWLRYDAGGSNNWVVSGERTASGKPIMAGDPHRAIEVPGVYYQNHVACDQFDVIGLSFPGLPGFPHFGHSERVAWCITHVGADSQDLFVERFDRDDPSRYLFKDEWLKAEVRQETILVRDADPVTITLTITHHGSVIAGNPASGRALAMRYTATLDHNPGWDTLLPMLTARSADEFESTMRDWVDPVNNLLYADVDGAFGYRMRGWVPKRTRLNAYLPVPGWTGEHEWQGMIPFEEMVAARNPAAEFVATANARPMGPDYPHYIALDFANDFRIRRIVDLITTKHDKFIASDMADIHRNVNSVAAVEFLDQLDLLQPTTPNGQLAKQQLETWSGDMRPDLAAPLIYNTLRECAVEMLLTPILGPLTHEAFHTAGRGAPAMLDLLRGRMVRLAATDDRSLLTPGLTWSDLFSKALDIAASQLVDLHGPDLSLWQWGTAHQVKTTHSLSVLFPDKADLLNPPPLPVGGDADTVQSASYTYSTGFTVTAASVARYVFDLSNWEACAWSVPGGTSGHPLHPHFNDQIGAWQHSDLLPMRYSWARIESESRIKQKLEPKGDQ